MNPDELIKKKFDSLVQQGESILFSCGYTTHSSPMNCRHPNDVDYRQYRAEALNLTRRVCGEESDHYHELKRIAETKETSTNSYYFKDCVGIVKAAKNDYEGGYLFDLKALVLAELLGDLLEQSEMLFECGYFSAAASLSGAVLEDALRKLSIKHSISVPDKTKIDKLNIELAKANIYSVLVQKRITFLADIRNNADHGHQDKFNKDDVDDMVKYVRRFVTDYLN